MTPALATGVDQMKTSVQQPNYTIRQKKNVRAILSRYEEVTSKLLAHYIAVLDTIIYMEPSTKS
jgi:hypothetical protein